MTDLRPFSDIMIAHVENDLIHNNVTLTKIGEITPETFNNYETHDYIKVQFANAIPDNFYLSKILFKVFQPFTNASTELISKIDLDPKNFLNTLNNVSIENLNTNIKDIDILINLSAINSGTWNAGNIGVYAYFTAIPSIVEATRQLELSVVDGDLAPVSGVQITINDIIVGVTDESGTLSIFVSTEELDYILSKEGYTTKTNSINAGIETYELNETLNIIVAETRRFSLTVKDTNQEVIPGAEVFITDVSIGTTNLNGFITGTVPNTPFSIGIAKNNLVFTPVIVDAGTEDIDTTKVLIRTLTVHVTDSLFTPIAGVSVYADNVLLGVTNAQGNYPTCQINPSVTNIKLTKEHYFEGNHNIDPLFSLDYSYNCFEVCRHFHILVKDIMEAPLPGVTVKISSVIAGYTNLNGIFETDFITGATTIQLIKTGYVEEDNNIGAGTEDITATSVLNYTIVTRNMNITVHDNNSMPVQGAGIYNGYATLLGTTDSNGQATVSIPNELWTLHIKKTHLYFIPETIDAGIIDINKNVSMTAARNIHIAVVDHNAMPIMYVQILKDNVAIADTDAMGVYNDTITFDEFTLGLHENSHVFTPILIPQGTDDLTLSESMYSLRVLNITVTDELEAAVSGADILFNDVIIGQTGITGNYTGNISSQAFTLKIEKTGFLFTPESMPADMDPLTLSKLLPSVRTLNLYFQKPGELPAVGISVYNGLVKIGESLPNGHAIVQISRLLDSNLTCTANHYFEADYFLAAGNDDVSDTVNITPCRSLILTVTDTDEAPLINAHVKQVIGIVETSLGYTDITGLLPTCPVTVEEFTLKIEKSGYGYIPEVINAGVIDLTITKQMMALRSLDLLVTDNSEIPVPLAGAHIYIGEFHLGDTGPDGYLNTGIPETETTITASLTDYTTQDLIIVAGIIAIDETIALVPAGE